MSWRQLFFAASVAAAAILSASAHAANVVENGRRTPIDASEPVEEDDEPDDSSTPIGEIKTVVDALRILNDAVRSVDAKFSELDQKIESVKTTNAENWLDLSAKIASVDVPDSVSQKEFSDFATSVRGDFEALKTTVGALPTEIPKVDFNAQADAIQAAQATAQEALEAKIDATRKDVGAVVENVAATQEQLKNVETNVGKIPSPFASFWGGLNAVATWIAALFATFRTTYFVGGWLKNLKRGDSAELERLRAKLQEFQNVPPQAPAQNRNVGTDLF